MNNCIKNISENIRIFFEGCLATSNILKYNLLRGRVNNVKVFDKVKMIICY